MTAPEDDLEKALRKALSAAVNQVEPAADGLDQIRARTSRRPPQPWPLSIVSAAIGRARNYVWRGHWAWKDKAALLVRLRRWSQPRRWSWHRSRPFVPVLGGIVFIACLSLAIPPFREAIVQVGSTVLTGDSNGGTNGGGGTTNGNGTLSGDGGAHGENGTGRGSSPSPGATRQQRCDSSALGGTGGSAVTGTAAITVASPTQPVESEAGAPPTRPAAHCSMPVSAEPTSSATAAASPSPQTSPSGTAPGSPSASASPSSVPTSSSPTTSPAESTPTSTATASPTDSGTIPPASSPATSSAGGTTADSGTPGTTQSPAAAPAH